MNNEERKEAVAQLEFAKVKLEMVDVSIDLYERQIAAMRKMSDICMLKPKPLEIKYEYEQDPVYWEAHVELYKVDSMRKIDKNYGELVKAQEARDALLKDIKKMKVNLK